MSGILNARYLQPSASSGGVSGSRCKGNNQGEACVEDREEDSGRSGAEQAFEDLRAEIKVLRQVVEALPETWAANRPANYTETLGAIAKKLETLASHLQAIEQHPAIRMSPKQHQQAIVTAGEELMHNAVQKLDRAAAAVVAEQRELAGLIGSVRGLREQRESLVWTGAVALLFGLLISPLFARFLPFGLDGQVAAFIMQANRWNAGATLMQAQSPEAWRDLESAAELLMSNKAALAACRDAAAKTKKEQHCAIVVPAL